MKKIFLIILSLLLILTSCAKKESDDVTANIITLKGPTGMGMAKMINDGKYDITMTSTPDDVTSAIISGSADIAAVPSNLASVLYNKTQGNVKIIALNTLGVLYILDSTDSIHSVSDLMGKTIGASGKGATPEYVLRYILEKNGLDPDNDVNIVYYSEHAELATLMASGKVEIGILPEPNVSVVLSKNSNAKRALDLTEEWVKADEDSELVMGCVIVREEFAKENPETVENFLKDCKDSVDYTNNDENAPALIAKLGIVPSEAIARSCIKSCNICCITGIDEMKSKLDGFLYALYSFEPKSVGGKLELDDLYYEVKK